MSIFSRLADVVNANLTALLDKAEDPQKMLRQIIQEMEDTLVEVRSSTAKVLAEKKQLSRKIKQLRQVQHDWQAKAELALSKQRDDLARAALIEKNQVASSIATQQDELDLLDVSLQQLQDEIEKLESKLNESRQRQAALLARQASVSNRYAVRQQLDSERAQKTREKFEQFQAKIDSLEARAEVLKVSETNPSLQKQFAELETEAEIADELAQLKAKMQQATEKN